MESTALSENIWTGSKVKLRAWEPADWQAQMRWHADTDGERADFAIPFPVSVEAVQQRVREHALQRPQHDVFNWIIAALSNDEAVGTLNTDNCDLTNGTFSYGLYIAPEHRRLGYATDAIVILLRFFFEERRYQKANAGVYAFNEASLRLHESVGFQVEGRLRSAFYSMGTYHDEVRFGMTAEEFAARYRQEA